MRYSVFAFAMFVLTFVSCQEAVAPGTYLPSFVGASGEVVVVMDKHLWNGVPGETIRAAFNKSYPVLPQSEPLFSIQWITEREFDKFWKPHRNIIHVTMADKPETEEPTTLMLTNKHAKEQVFIEILCKDNADFVATFEDNREFIIQAINQAEIKRLSALTRKYEASNLSNSMEQKHGIFMSIPRDARMKVDRDDFIWIDRQMTRAKGGRNHDVQQGFFIYSRPYVSDTMFSPRYLLSQRDSVLKANVPGSVDGSYMSTEYRYYPSYEEVPYNGEFAGELRGLWRMEGEFMGGPFYSITVLNKFTNELVTVDGYAYAPYFDKREYIREVEAIVNTIRFSEVKN